MYFLTTAKIQVFRNYIIAWLDPEISNYYRALIPKYKCVNPPMAPCHITVVRPFEFANRYKWSRFDGEIVDVRYWLPVRTDGLYFWLDADSDRIVKIRRELGLSDYLKNGCLHITVGNLKRRSHEISSD